MSTNNPTRLTPAQHAVLSLLRAQGEATGWQLIKASNGAIARGSVYVLLARLRERGFVSSRGGSDRRDPVYYRVTPAGELALAAWSAAQSAWK